MRIWKEDVVVVVMGLLTLVTVIVWVVPLVTEELRVSVIEVVLVMKQDEGMFAEHEELALKVSSAGILMMMVEPNIRVLTDL